MAKQNYFVSYYYEAKNHTGFGNGMFGMEGITDMNDILSLTRFVTDKLRSKDKIRVVNLVILNFREV